MKSFQTQTHYEVLEISVGASPAEVRNAYERLSLLYSDDQVVLYGLIDPARAAALRHRMKEALEVLSDEQRREAYDVKIGLPPRVVPKPAAAPKPVTPAAASGASAGTGWGTFAWVTPGGPAHTPTRPASYTYAVTPTKPVAAPPPALVVPVPARMLAVTPPMPAKREAAPAPTAPAPLPAAPVEPAPQKVAPAAPVEPAPVKAAVPAMVEPTPATAVVVAATPAPMEPVPAAAPAVEPTPAAAEEVAAPVKGEPVAPPAPEREEPRQLALDVSSGVAGWGPRAAREPLAPQELEPVVAAPPVPSPVASAPLPITVVVPEPAPAPLAAPSAPLPVVVAAPAPAPEPPPLASAPLPIVVVAPAAAPEPAPPEKPAEEPPIPTLADDAQVAIVPARATPSREFRVEQRPRPYEIPEGVEINGDLLKQVRMARGLSLVQVADRTRIGVKHLENVEGDRYDALPAAVYLRGILMNLARELGLDGLRVSKSYLTFVEAHRSKG